MLDQNVKHLSLSTSKEGESKSDDENLLEPIEVVEDNIKKTV